MLDHPMPECAAHPSKDAAMTQPSDAERRFGEQEMRKILALAARIQARDGRTRIRVAIRAAEVLWVPYFVVLIYALIGVGAGTRSLHLPAPAELAIAAGILGGAVSATRLGIQAWFRKKTRAAHELMECLIEVATRSQPNSTEPIVVSEPTATQRVAEVLHANRGR